jgi:hypothetical protein
LEGKMLPQSSFSSFLDCIFGYAILIAGLIVTPACLYFIARWLLVLLGRNKTPILRQFGKYGEEEFYCPLLNLLFWLIAFVVGAQLLLIAYTRDISPWNAPFWLSLAMLAYLCLPEVSARVPRWIRHLLEVLQYYPYWYHDLRSRTSRYERRRIAYLWLRLPAYVRSTHDSDDGTFMDWADLVIMGSVMEEDPG